MELQAAPHCSLRRAVALRVSPRPPLLKHSAASLIRVDQIEVPCWRVGRWATKMHDWSNMPLV